MVGFVNRGREIKISSWNIHGYKSKYIGNKLNDSDFLKEIKDDVIVGLVETHMHDDIVENLCIPGFELLSFKNRPLNKNSKTSSGGVAFFVKDSVSRFITKVDNDNKDSLWLKLKKDQLGVHEDIFIGLIYISPPVYKIFRKR